MTCMDSVLQILKCVIEMMLGLDQFILIGHVVDDCSSGLYDVAGLLIKLFPLFLHDIIYNQIESQMY